MIRIIIAFLLGGLFGFILAAIIFAGTKEAEDEERRSLERENKGLKTVCVAKRRPRKEMPQMSELKPCPMAADEAISALEMCQSLMLFDPMTGETHELCEENKDNQDLYNACSLAIDASRRVQPANEPLTLDELRKMRGKVVDIPESGFWYSGRGTVLDDGVYDPKDQDGYWPFEYYGEWLAYDHKPGGEQDG